MDRLGKARLGRYLEDFDDAFDEDEQFGQARAVEARQVQQRAQHVAVVDAHRDGLLDEEAVLEKPLAVVEGRLGCDVESRQAVLALRHLAQVSRPAFRDVNIRKSDTRKKTSLPF